MKDGGDLYCNRRLSEFEVWGGVVWIPSGGATLPTCVEIKTISIKTRNLKEVRFGSMQRGRDTNESQGENDGKEDGQKLGQKDQPNFDNPRERKAKRFALNRSGVSWRDGWGRRIEVKGTRIAKDVSPKRNLFGPTETTPT